ncbi:MULTISPECIES: CYTH domain-containing protein [Enterocloster]|mgnify:FL=1|uniref:CYTH domain-containing protein n=1 Tax=Enterocloster lavalensis TaxID=460384 RepID=A0A1I0C5Y0_9FIRM|nr:MULTISPECIES: CYTH domain-containing protein [Enterocloster]MDR3757620.1 CYTH domain-containing protein [Enterocloster sp.]SET14892.1 CYTH domain-containing protein [Enterocloster lavalensis]
MEIERKYRIAVLPEHYRSYPVRAIEQAYLCTDPVVRVRRDGGEYYLTYKGRGLLAREEYNLPLNEQAYRHLLEKADGIVLTKDRYRIPMTGTYAHLTIELDVFSGVYSGLILAEVEFPTVEEAEAFVPPEWFTEDVTMSGEYQNSRLSSGKVDFC